MPAKATMGLILGGELLDHRDAVAYGLWNLRQLGAMLTRRGINSEFNSPTYTPLSIHAFSEIAAHSRNAEARQLALDIEQRLWIDVAARYHPDMGVVAGPSARSYAVDTLGHVSNMASLLWLLLGDAVNPSPMLLFQPDADIVLHHRGDRPFNIAQMCCWPSGSYHVPDRAMEMFARKSYPCRAVATCESGGGRPDFPAHAQRIETLLHADFALGTCDTQSGSGEQSMSYFVTYRRRAPVRSWRDLGTVFHKLTVNEQVPGMIGFLPGAPAATKTGGADAASSGSGSRGEEDSLDSRANSRIVQADATALVLAHPHLALAGNDAVEPRPISRLRHMLVFPAHYGRIDEVLVDGEARQWHGDVPGNAWIACRAGRLLIAVRPLAYTAAGRVRVALETHNRYQCLSFYLYDGPEKTFTRTALSRIYSGFVAEHAGIDEYASLSEFAGTVADAVFSDYFWITRRVRYLRPERPGRPALELAVSWEPGAVVARYATVNGRPVTDDVVAIDGIEAATLPLLAAPAAPVPPFFPWRELAVEWEHWHAAIGDREA